MAMTPSFWIVVAAALGLLVICLALWLHLHSRRLRLLSQAIKAVPAPFAVYDRAERLIVCNDLYRSHHAKALAKHRGPGRPTYRELVNLAAPDELSPEERDQLVEAVLSNQPPLDGEMAERHYPHIGWLRVGRQAMPNGGSVRLALDITELKAKQIELETALERAIVAERVQSDFVATMNHELRTPLNGIIGMTKILQAGADDEAVREQLEVIENSGLHLLSVVNQVLLFGKLTSQITVDLSYEEFRLDELLEDTLSSLRHASDAHDLTLSLSLPPEFRPERLGDPAKVRQIVTNFLGNAIKFAPERPIDLIVEEGVERVDDVKISVVDRGPGMTATDLAVIFERFKQVSNGEARTHGGTGLGLAISQELAEMLGGSVGAHSVRGEGSSFWVTLPMPHVETLAEAASLSVRSHSQAL